MGRPGRPWRRKPSNDWYAKIEGKQTKLADSSATFDQAQAEWVRLKAMAGSNPAASAALTVRDLCDLFLEDVSGAVGRGERESVTLAGYLQYLKSAARSFGETKAVDLRPRHVKSWVDGKKRWGPTSRFNGITAIKAVFSWGRKQGYLDADPIRDMKKPTPKKREEIINPEQADRVMAAMTEPLFRDFLEAIRETGCRPKEIFGLTASMVDLDKGIWTVRNKTRNQTGERTRTVYLTDRMVELSRRLAEKHPEGPIFRNRLGNPWTRFSVALRFERLRKRLGMGPGLTAYAFRHLFATDALDRGVPVATVAELMGHHNIKTLMSVYNKLRVRREHLRDAVRKARGQTQ